MPKSYPLSVGLFGIGLEAYWPQFEGLKPRLAGYLSQVADKIARSGFEICNLGLIDSPEKAIEAGYFRQTTTLPKLESSRLTATAWVRTCLFSILLFGL